MKRVLDGDLMLITDCGRSCIGAVDWSEENSYPTLHNIGQNRCSLECRELCRPDGSYPNNAYTITYRPAKGEQILVKFK